MKRAYVRPTMVGERFVANEYVAACWRINCNVPNGYGYIDNNGNSRFDSGDKLLTPKGVLGPEANAMWHPSLSVGKDYPVYYWRDGNEKYDIHFSKVQDAQWATNPNAS